MRLVNAYDPFLSNTQTLTLQNNNPFTLTFKGQTATINYFSDVATMVAKAQDALSALSTVGPGNVTVTSPSNSSNSLTVTFGGALSVAAQPALIPSDPQNEIVGYSPQYANAALSARLLSPLPITAARAIGALTTSSSMATSSRQLARSSSTPITRPWPECSVRW